MKKEKNLLLLGLLFSIVLVQFQFKNRLEFLGLITKFYLVDIALDQSNQTYVNSSVLGYVFFFLFGINSLKKVIDNKAITLHIFLVLSFLGLVIETYAIYADFHNHYNGIHFQIGILLAVIGYYYMSKNKRLLS